MADVVSQRSDLDDTKSQNTPVEQAEKESTLYWQIGQKLVPCMLHLYTSNIWTDVTFRCRNHAEDGKADRIHAHKIVLAARSPFFRGMLFGPCAENREMEVDLLTTEAEILDLVMRYIYSDETTLTEDTAPRVLELAHMYQITGLVEYCSEFLAYVMRLDNVFEILDLSLLYDLNKLSNTACHVIDIFAKQVLDSDEFLRISKSCLTYILKGNTFFENEGYIFKRAMDWAECQLSRNGETVDGQKKRNVLGEAFFYLRVPTLSTLEFLKCTKGEIYYTAQEIVNIIEYINDKSCTASLCHSTVTRAPKELEVRIPIVNQRDLAFPLTRLCASMTLEVKYAAVISCILMITVSKDCFIHSISLKKIFPFLPNPHDVWSRRGQEYYKRDNCVDITLDGVLCIDELQFRTTFQMRQNKQKPIMFGNPLLLRKTNTPYSLKFGMKYRSEHSLFYMEVVESSRRQDRCEGKHHTNMCLRKTSPRAGGIRVNYCNSSKHFNCIDSLQIRHLPGRTNES